MSITKHLQNESPSEEIKFEITHLEKAQQTLAREMEAVQDGRSWENTRSVRLELQILQRCYESARSKIRALQEEKSQVGQNDTTHTF